MDTVTIVPGEAAAIGIPVFMAAWTAAAWATHRWEFKVGDKRIMLGFISTAVRKFSGHHPAAAGLVTAFLTYLFLHWVLGIL